jgi:RND family efflux transporter MFP subunit
MSESIRTKQSAEESRPAKTLFKGVLRIFMKAVVPLAIVAMALGFLKYQMDTRPKAERRSSDQRARLVTVETVQTESRPALIQAMGTVRAATEVTLTPEVTGIIIEMDPSVLPGGIVGRDQILYRIDSRDYEAIVKQRQSEVVNAELALKLEVGNQTVARQEYELLGELIDEQDRELVLRKPQLESARQSLAAARAALLKAELDVQRCTIRSPFNAVIKTKLADVGARVSPTAPLATLTGTDEYWVEALVPMDQLQWIQFPNGGQAEGSSVHIENPSVWKQGQYREGRILRLMGQLEEAGRMAKLIVSVPDPLRLQHDANLPPLLIGSYVRAAIEGISVPNVVILQREYLRDGNNVWVMNDTDALEIRKVDIIFRSREAVYISHGLSDGERVVSSDLSTAVEGMPLRLNGGSRNHSAVSGPEAKQ